jgi:hypothetical protein
MRGKGKEENGKETILRENIQQRRDISEDIKVSLKKEGEELCCQFNRRS